MGCFSCFVNRAAVVFGYFGIDPRPSTSLTSPSNLTGSLTHDAESWDVIRVMGANVGLAVLTEMVRAKCERVTGTRGFLTEISDAWFRTRLGRSRWRRWGWRLARTCRLRIVDDGEELVVDLSGRGIAEYCISAIDFLHPLLGGGIIAVAIGVVPEGEVTVRLLYGIKACGP